MSFHISTVNFVTLHRPTRERHQKRHKRVTDNDTNWRAIVVTGIPDPQLGRQFFGRFRDELWEINEKSLVFITPDEVDTYATPPADAFFQCVVRR